VTQRGLGTESAPFRIGEWSVDPASGTLRSDDVARHLEPQVMDLLVLLASRPGEVLSKQEILAVVWSGRFVGEDSLTGAISQLRKALGDERRNPRFVETIPKRGYRLIAHPEDGDAPSPSLRTGRRRRAWRRTAAAGGLAGALIGGALAWFTAGGGRAPIRTLAVLPLKSLSPDPRDVALADGLTAALITELARLAPLRVIAHTSVMGYRGSGKTGPEIARELGVDGVLEGSVTRAGRRVRVDALLIDASRGTHLWAESYDRELGDALELQAQIARSVARGIRVRLAGRDAAPRPPRAVSRAAMEAYLRGRALVAPRAPDDLRQAQIYLERATRLEPRFAEAFAALAETSLYLIDHGAPPDTPAQARAQALEALALDPDLPEARAAHGAVLAFVEWDLTGSESELRRALELQPSLAAAHRTYAWVLSALGRHDEAVSEARGALDLDPLNLQAYWDLAEILLQARRFDETAALMERALELDPDASNSRFNIAFARWFQRDEAGAYAAFRRGLELEGLTPEALQAIDATFSREGMPAVFGLVADYIERRPVQSPATRRHVAIYAAAAGDPDRAIANLEELRRLRSPGMIAIAVSPHMDPLRSDPRFEALLRRMPFPSPRNPPSGFPR